VRGAEQKRRGAEQRSRGAERARPGAEQKGRGAEQKASGAERATPILEHTRSLERRATWPLLLTVPGAERATRGALFSVARLGRCNPRAEQESGRWRAIGHVPKVAPMLVRFGINTSTTDRVRGAPVQ